MQQTGGFVRRQAAIRGQIEHRGGGFGGIGVFQQQGFVAGEGADRGQGGGRGLVVAGAEIAIVELGLLSVVGGRPGAQTFGDAAIDGVHPFP